LGDFRCPERSVGLAKDEITTDGVAVYCVLTPPDMFNIRELSRQKTAYTTSKRMLTQGLQQFIKDHLSAILLAESKGALPGEPESLSKKRRRDEDNDENPERTLAARMIALVEVNFFTIQLMAGIDESTCKSERKFGLGSYFGG
jgi:hypothetical protein